MDFAFSDEQIAIRDTARRFVADEIVPREPEVLRRERNGEPGVTADERRDLQLRARKFGFWGMSTPEEYGGMGLPALTQALIWTELGRSFVPFAFGGEADNILYEANESQRAEYLVPTIEGERRSCFAITEPGAGSDAANIKTSARRDGDDWVINGEKTFNTGVHVASHDLVFARTSGQPGSGEGITAFLTPVSSPGFTVEEYLWTFNMPTDHAHVRLRDVRVPGGAVFGGEGRGLQVVQHFFNENRIRQAASSLDAAQYCISESVAYALERKPFGKPLAANQAIQFPLVELQTQCEMLRALIHKTAWLMDTEGPFSASDKVSMCNYWANRLCCEAADRAMQVHGGLGYSRHKPFEHIYRHHRRYRITEGAEEIQMRRVAGYMFGFMRQRAPKGVAENGAAGAPGGSGAPGAAGAADGAAAGVTGS
jgi:acyl-CoA dehydrogenase